MEISQAAIKRLSQAVLASGAKCVLEDRQTSYAPWNNDYRETKEFNLRWAESEDCEVWCRGAGVSQSAFAEGMRKVAQRTKKQNKKEIARIAKEADEVNSRVKRGHKKSLGVQQITHLGRTQTITEWCKELSLCYATVINRRGKFMPVHLVLSTKRIPKNWATMMIGRNL